MGKPELGMLVWRHSRDPIALERMGRRDSGWRPANLRKEGLDPATVIDVGACTGTPVLYRAFPAAYHVLIEPLAECAAALTRHLAARRGEHVECAVGSRSGRATLRVDPNALWGSSLLGPAGAAGDGAVEREVAVTTLDALATERPWRPPFGLKIDVEGAEAQVIEGATELLASTQFVIAEISITRRFEEAPSFARFIALMDERGFELVDILEGFKGSRTGEMTYLDALFRRSGQL